MARPNARRKATNKGAFGMTRIPFFFTVSQAKQILSLIDWNKEEGVYSGRLDYWNKRNKAIKTEITNRLILEGVRE